MDSPPPNGARHKYTPAARVKSTSAGQSLLRWRTVHRHAYRLTYRYIPTNIPILPSGQRIKHVRSYLFVHVIPEGEAVVESVSPQYFPGLVIVLVVLVKQPAASNICHFKTSFDVIKWILACIGKYMSHNCIQQLHLRSHQLSYQHNVKTNVMLLNCHSYIHNNPASVPLFRHEPLPEMPLTIR